MKKTSIFKALALGLLSLALPIGSAQAAGPANCPAFNAAMVDAAALAAFSPSSPLDPPGVTAVDNPMTARIVCIFDTEFGFFEVNVSEGGVAFVRGLSIPPGTSDAVSVFNVVDGLIAGQRHACRSAILQSWVWNNVCAAAVQ